MKMSTENRILKEMLLHAVFGLMMEIAGAINYMVDGIIVGKWLGETALAATGITGRLEKEEKKDFMNHRIKKCLELSLTEEDQIPQCLEEVKEFLLEAEIDEEKKHSIEAFSQILFSLAGRESFQKGRNHQFSLRLLQTRRNIDLRTKDNCQMLSTSSSQEALHGLLCLAGDIQYAQVLGINQLTITI